MIGWIMAVLAIGSTVLLVRKKVNIGFIMLMDAAYLAIGAGLPSGDAGLAAWRAVKDVDTLSVIAILVLIMMVEHTMREKGMIRDLVDAVRDLTGNTKIASVALPAVLGLLPSPGGARFSCPMVKGAMDADATGEDRAYVNYWYRHVWMDAFFLYPGVILAASLIGMPVMRLFLWMMPFMVLHGLSGYFLVLRRMPAQPIPRTRSKKEAGKALLRAGVPILFVIITYIILLPFSDFALQIAGLMTVILTFVYGRCNKKEIFSAVKAGFSLKYIIMIVGVMVFREVLEASGLTGALVSWIGERGISPRWLYAFLPLLGGLGSGIAVSMVSLSFPVLLPLGLLPSIPWVVAAVYACGIAGDMITPLHICGVVSTEYFKADMGRVYARVALSEIPILIAAAAILVFL
jgi:integral membrane protein (TIGR00529 family)